MALSEYDLVNMKTGWYGADGDFIIPSDYEKQAANEILRLRQELEQSRANCAEYFKCADWVIRYGFLGAHQEHWDKKGTHGRNCPACIANDGALERLRKLTKDNPGQPLLEVVNAAKDYWQAFYLSSSRLSPATMQAIQDRLGKALAALEGEKGDL